MRIFAAGIATETNTFVPLPTGLDDFTVTRPGDAVSAAGNPLIDQLHLWRDLAETRGHAFVSGLMAWAEPSGITTKSSYETLREEMLDGLAAALPVDVVLLNLHGAMVANGYDDCEEDMIRHVRALAGPVAIIGVELDLHCHLSEAKIADADVVITYKEYPHTDVNDRARELFDLAIAAKLGQVKPTMALFDCRMVGFYPTSREPMRGFVESMRSAEGSAGICSVSFGHGFPLGDVPHMGAKMLVVTAGNHELAATIAMRFGKGVNALRRDIGFESMSLPLRQALETARTAAAHPVVVADQSDNVGAGAPGDATYALRWLMENGVENAAVAILYDPEVVKIARKAGIGATLPFRLGGKTCPLSGEPLDVDATVIGLADNYLHRRPQQSGEPVYHRAGDVVALRFNDIDVIVSSERCQCFCPSIFSDFGVDPTARELLIVKSIQHFHAGFRPIAAQIIYMAGPGAVSPDPLQIPYRRVDISRLYPWNDDPIQRAPPQQAG